MSALAHRLLERHYADRPHSYRILEAKVEDLLRAEASILDAGCGRIAPTLRKYVGKARTRWLAVLCPLRGLTFKALRVPAW